MRKNDFNATSPEKIYNQSQMEESMKCLTLSLFLPLPLTFAFVGSGPEGEERLTKRRM